MDFLNNYESTYYYTKYAELCGTDPFITEYKWKIYHLSRQAKVINFPLVRSDKVIGNTQRISIFGVYIELFKKCCILTPQNRISSIYISTLRARASVANGASMHDVTLCIVTSHSHITPLPYKVVG